MFTLPERMGVIELGNSDYAGAEIRCCISSPLWVERRIIELAAVGGTDADAAWEEAIGLFVKYGLRSWNLVHPVDGELPATLEGMRSLDPPLQAAIIRAWVRITNTVPVPLGRASDATSPSDESSAKPRRRTSRSRS